MDLNTLRAALNTNFFNISHNQWLFMTALSAFMGLFLSFFVLHAIIRDKQRFNGKGDKLARGFIYFVTIVWIFIFAISINKLVIGGITHIHFTVDFSF